MKSTDSVIVSWNFSRGKDVGVLIVGSQKNGRMDVINAYQGKEAYELYQKLTVKKKGASNNDCQRCDVVEDGIENESK